MYNTLILASKNIDLLAELCVFLWDAYDISAWIAEIEDEDETRGVYIASEDAHHPTGQIYGVARAFEAGWQRKF